MDEPACKFIPFEFILFFITRYKWLKGTQVFKYFTIMMKKDLIFFNIQRTAK